ncbi:OmpP1/FadL family transporter [Capnocytophaga sputigena]|jgi:membrane protein involved in aromatic hydrocarbon degradation|uniref:OmpP1/FadL family transporter n=1 Tax=Capnocytophaga sputigena TaxID=1019 RepID=UPI0028D64110|nr:outer membrane protein transport protein [Capnocytophaga sputigena]
MKKVNHILLLLAFLFVVNIQAQNYTDALRYTTEELTGTARFKAMSGAFGALGGDPSAFNINPAGSAVFNASEISFSLNNNNQKRNIAFLDRNHKQSNNDFNLNHFGLVLTLPDASPTFKRISFGFNYQLAKTFDNDKFSYSAYNSKGLDDYFLYYVTKGNGGNPFSFDTFANGYNYRYANQQEEIGEYYAKLGRTEGYAAQMAYLGLMANVLSPQSLTATNTTYIPSGYNQERLETYRIDRSGYINKYNFNFSSQIGDFIYLGMNLNVHNINEKALYSLKDENFQNNNPLLRYANHKQYINTLGEGISLQLGSIIKITDNLRVGVAYQSPTWYSLKEESRQVLYATLGIASRTYDYDVELINRYGDPIWYEREYKFRTPGSWTGSIAYIIKKRAILSVDYTYKAYDNMKFRSNNMKAENTIIQNELGDTSSLRVGGEFRIPFKLLKEQEASRNYVSLRAGYRYEQSPYRKKIAPIGDLNGYSFGAGITLGGIRLDASYDIAKQTNLYQMYETVLTDNAQIKSTYGNFLFTFTAQLF